MELCVRFAEGIAMLNLHEITLSTIMVLFFTMLVCL